MAMLTGPEIARQVALGGVVIDPFDPARVGANSYDALLAADYRVYVGRRGRGRRGCGGTSRTQRR